MLTFRVPRAAKYTQELSKIRCSNASPLCPDADRKIFLPIEQVFTPPKLYAGPS